MHSYKQIARHQFANLVCCILCENSLRMIQGVCVWVWVFPVRPESVCKQTPMSSWAFGLSTTPSQRGNVDLHTHTHTLTSTQTVYAYMHRQAAHHHTQTSINTHIYSTTHSHTNTFPLAPTGDRRCHVYWLAGNFNRREWETSSYHCLSPPDMPPPLALLFFPFFVSFRRLYINTLVSLFVQGNNSASFIAPQI